MFPSYLSTGKNSKIPVSTPNPAVPLQVCTYCGEKNASANAFCKKCGHILHNEPVAGQPAVALANQQRPPSAATPSAAIPPEPSDPAAPEKPSGKMRGILMIIIILAFLAVAAGVVYVWYSHLIRQEARNYLAVSSDNFMKTVVDINQLSTEMAIDDQTDENIELAVKRNEEEESRIAVLQEDIKVAVESLNRNKANRLVEPMDNLLRQFYDECKEKNNIYGRYVDYNLKTGREMAKFEEEMEKIRRNYQSANSITDLRNIFVALRDSIDSANNNLKIIEPPAGLEQAHNKSIQMFTDISRSLTGIVGAIDENNEQKLNEALNNLEDTFSDTKAIKDIEELENYYFDELHKKFVTLREKADKIKGEFIEYKATLKAEIKDVNIEGW